MQSSKPPWFPLTGQLVRRSDKWQSLVIYLNYFNCFNHCCHQPPCHFLLLFFSDSVFWFNSLDLPCTRFYLLWSKSWSDHFRKLWSYCYNRKSWDCLWPQQITLLSTNHIVFEVEFSELIVLNELPIKEPRKKTLCQPNQRSGWLKVWEAGKRLPRWRRI